MCYGTLKFNSAYRYPAQNNCVFLINTLNSCSFVVVNSGYAEARRESDAANATERPARPKPAGQPASRPASQPSIVLPTGRNQPGITGCSIASVEKTEQAEVSKDEERETKHIQIKEIWE